MSRSIASGLVENPKRVKRTTSTFGLEKYPSVVSGARRPRVSVTAARAAPCAAVPVSFAPAAFSVNATGFGSPGAAKRSVRPLLLSATCACATWPGPNATVAALPATTSVRPDVSAPRNVIVPE